ncbi:MAG TPA: ADP-ribosylglycohydrolase family protein, partial [Clostridia bacterium]|nr:ADP-ribosylglycohydrolase family protein [Clostridia bacterium]
GVSYGAPTEFRFNAKLNEQKLEWSPGMLGNTLDQDDLYVEMTFAKVMDDLGLNASCEDYGEAFKVSKYSLWHANAGARRALGRGIKAPWSGHPKYNAHTDDIDFQIEADFIGLMCPSLPRESNKYCDRVGRVMNYGDGLYGGMFVCGMYSAAFFESDPRKVVSAGLACIPTKSQYALLIKDALAWSERYPNDWRKVWQLIEDKWDTNDACPEGALQPLNIDAKLNGVYIALGLLFGGGDFGKTMEISIRCGQDSDCNPSSAAGVLGVMVGYNRIPEAFKSGIAAIEDKKFSFTDYSFNSIVKSTEIRALKIVQATGGKVSDQGVTIRVQKPKAPRLEQWSPGIPDRRVKADDGCWSYRGAWQTDRGAKVSTKKGDEATLAFEGVAVVVLGELSPSGGRADVYLDGKKVDTADAYVVERTHDDAFWHIYGLKPGRHTVRLVTTEEADARPRGTRVALRGAVMYRQKQ